MRAEPGNFQVRSDKAELRRSIPHYVQRDLRMKLQPLFCESLLKPSSHPEMQIPAPSLTSNLTETQAGLRLSRSAPSARHLFTARCSCACETLGAYDEHLKLWRWLNAMKSFRMIHCTRPGGISDVPKIDPAPFTRNWRDEWRSYWL
jgi:hypothetical protein